MLVCPQLGVWGVGTEKDILPQKIMDLALGSKLIADINFLFPFTPTYMPDGTKVRNDDSSYHCARRKHRKQIYDL